VSLPSAARRFLAHLGPAGVETLRTRLRTALQTPPRHWIPWYCSCVNHASSDRIGVLSPQRADVVRASLEDCVWRDDNGTRSLHWHAGVCSEAERSAQLQHALLHWHSQGLVHGWRGEPFAFWRHDTDHPPQPPDLISKWSVPVSGTWVSPVTRCISTGSRHMAYSGAAAAP